MSQNWLSFYLDAWLSLSGHLLFYPLPVFLGGSVPSSLGGSDCDLYPISFVG